MCWKNIGLWASEKGRDQPIASVFEEGTGGKGEILRVHSKLQEKPSIVKKYRLGTIAFETKEKSKALQAADFFAYETYKRMIENITDVKRQRKSIEGIVTGIPLYATYAGDENTDAAIASISAALALQK